MLGRPGIIREELEVVVIDQDDYDRLMRTIDAAESLACAAMPLLKELNTPFARPDVNYGIEKAQDVLRLSRELRISAESDGSEISDGYEDDEIDELDQIDDYYEEDMIIAGGD